MLPTIPGPLQVPAEAAVRFTGASVEQKGPTLQKEASQQVIAVGEHAPADIDCIYPDLAPEPELPVEPPAIISPFAFTWTS